MQDPNDPPRSDTPSPPSAQVEKDPEEIATAQIAEVLRQEREFEAQMKTVTRVKEDDLSTVFLGPDNTKPVKISAHLEPAFREQLVHLLTEFKDVFAWDYSDMKGLDPRFYQHRIPLKPEATPVRMQRYRMNPHMAK